MPTIERTSQLLVARSGSTTLTLSRAAGQAVLQRKLLFWKLRPTEAPLSDIIDVTVHAGVDRASGAEVCKTILLLRTGAGWTLPCSGKEDALAKADAIGDFLGIDS
jgi:hypothetical protein